MIHEDNRHHGFCYWRGADANAGVVTAFGDDFDRLAMNVDAAPGQAQAGGGF